MSVAIDILEVPAPFGLETTAPEEVWVWAFNGFAMTAQYDGAEFVLASHSEEELRIVVAKARAHSPISAHVASFGSPVKVKVETIEARIRASELRAIVGWTLRDRDGEVMRRYLR